MKFIQDLQLVAFLPNEREDSELDVAMWQSDENICELRDEQAALSRCLTTHGIYFGTSDSREPKFCPQHYFGDLGYKIEPEA